MNGIYWATIIILLVIIALIIWLLGRGRSSMCDNRGKLNAKCSETSDCNSGLVCDKSGKNKEGICKVASGGVCSNSSECSDGLVCRSGICQAGGHHYSDSFSECKERSRSRSHRKSYSSGSHSKSLSSDTRSHSKPLSSGSLTSLSSDNGKPLSSGSLTSLSSDTRSHGKSRSKTRSHSKSCSKSDIYKKDEKSCDSCGELSSKCSCTNTSFTASSEKN